MWFFFVQEGSLVIESLPLGNDIESGSHEEEDDDSSDDDEDDGDKMDG